MVAVKAGDFLFLVAALVPHLLTTLRTAASSKVSENATVRHCILTESGLITFSAKSSNFLLSSLLISSD